jgi:hypothetical protein
VCVGEREKERGRERYRLREGVREGEDKRNNVMLVFNFFRI